MEHIFKVIDASVGDFSEQPSILERLRRKEFGSSAGISVQSRIENFKKGILYLSSEIKYIGIENGIQHDGLTGYYLTVFEFVDGSFFKSEQEDLKLSVLEKCFHLAEAHAYAMMCSQAIERGLKTPLMEPTPAEKLRKWAIEFLNKQ